MELQITKNPLDQEAINGTYVRSEVSKMLFAIISLRDEYQTKASFIIIPIILSVFFSGDCCMKLRQLS